MCSVEKFWTSDQDEVLINFIKQHECLYNVKSKDFRKGYLKQILWKELGALLSKTDIECCRRWTYVRDYYIRRRGKPKTIYSGEAARKRAEQLKFLDNVSSTKKSSFGTNNQDDYLIEDDRKYYFIKPEDIEDEILADQIEHSDEYQIEIAREDSENESSNQYNIPHIEADILNTPSADQKYILPKIDDMSDAEERLIILRQLAEQKQPVLDENDHFFSSMAKIVKKLPPKEQAAIRLNVGKIVGNAEIEYWSTSSS